MIYAAAHYQNERLEGIVRYGCRLIENRSCIFSVPQLQNALVLYLKSPMRIIIPKNVLNSRFCIFHSVLIVPSGLSTSECYSTDFTSNTREMHPLLKSIKI